MAACAVVAIQTTEGPEPCAVLALRGPGTQAAAIIERANLRLAEFQRMRRWLVWPEPDLPRTSTGKIRRKVVAAWLGKMHETASGNGNGHHLNGNGNGNNNGKPAASSDWLLTLIAQVSGETPPGSGDELYLTEDLHLDSLGRVQLAAAIEERAGIDTENGLWDQVQTLGDLRRLLNGTAQPMNHHRVVQTLEVQTPNASSAPQFFAEPTAERESEMVFVPTPSTSYVYPHWPWWAPVRWLRAAFIEAALRPLVWLLSKPTVTESGRLEAAEPMLIVANHVTTFDGPFLQYALPGPLRRRMAVAMSGEMLEDYRRFRDADRLTVKSKFFLPGPLYYFLLTALFNVFPLPKQRDFQRSFAHAGEALDKGMHVLLFPEGTRSAEGKLAAFRPGIGLLVKQSLAPVLPMAIRGLGELKTRQRGWFRSGTVEVRIGEPDPLWPRGKRSKHHRAPAPRSE